MLTCSSVRSSSSKCGFVATDVFVDMLLGKEGAAKDIRKLP